ncbi:MAG: GGDEF domain-containing protein [Sphingomonas bacterium]
MALTLLAICAAAPAFADVVNIRPSLCHAVTEVSRGDAALATLRFSCTGEPQGYRDGSLWLTARMDGLPVDPNDISLMVHQSRFARLAVAFTYADGTVRWQTVRSGNFAGRWRAGGQVLFVSPQHDAPVRSVTMRFDRLSDYNLIHARVMSKEQSATQAIGMAAASGAALTLLLVGGLYAFSLAVAVRRQYLAWHGAWAACMVVWGATWSQLHLLILPGAAGEGSARFCTFLSCVAVALGTASTVTAPGPGKLPRALRIAALALGLSVAVLGIPLSLMHGDRLMLMADMLGVLIIVDLLVVACCLVWAWRRGAGEVRDLAGAWFVPMAVLGLVQVLDIEDDFWGAGSKLLMLLGATWQTLWLAVAATRRLGRLRIERDLARAAEARAQELARRDALTGLRNRRGFVESAAPLIARARADRLPAALLLVDIDRFKSINDQYGHEAGDVVLARVGRRIGSWEGAMCAVGRLGGEEFALLAVGLEGVVLERFAESVRAGIAACDHGEAIGGQAVTASLGVAEVFPAEDFPQLFRLADAALYDAKRDGRNRIVLRRKTNIEVESAPGRRSAARRLLVRR